MIRHVAIIGGGFSGTLQAINLLRHEGPRATLIERARNPGLGVAYGAAQDEHLLNVRAGGMSAIPDEPDHFVRWLAARGVANAGASFVQRIVYGEYLREMLEDAAARSQGRLEVMQGEVVDLDQRDGGTRLHFAGGGTLNADAAVLAVGNLPPHTPPGLVPENLPPSLYFGDPWDGSVAERLGPDDTVLVIGTGLTMIDVVLTLDARGFAGRIVALSRRGLLPHRHAEVADWDRIHERPAATGLSALLRDTRRRGEVIGWRAAVDELRPFTQSMWRNATGAQRQRFVRHLRPWWDIHRHRLAPQIADRIAALIAARRLEVLAGKTLDFAEAPGGATVTWRPRSEDARQQMIVQRIVNCIGPLGDLSRTQEPLLRRLVERGRIRPDSAHLGIDVDSEARTVAADGTANADLFALGPMTRGAFWEIVAVPDIRSQTWTLARRLSNAHWVGGEGL